MLASENPSQSNPGVIIGAAVMSVSAAVIIIGIVISISILLVLRRNKARLMK